MKRFFLSFVILFVLCCVSIAFGKEIDTGQVKSLNKTYMDLFRKGEYRKALPLAVQELTLLETTYGPDHKKVGVSLENLTILYIKLGDFAKARAICQRALALNESLFGLEHPNVGPSLNNSGLIFHNAGDHANAEKAYKRALAIDENIYGSEHPKLIDSLNNLATLYMDLGDYKKADLFLKRTLNICGQALEPDHPNLAITLSNLAVLAQHRADYAKAESYYKQALLIEEKNLGPDHPNIARALNNLASNYSDIGDYLTAGELLKRSLKIYVNVFGSDHLDTAKTLHNLGTVAIHLGVHSKAETYLKRAQTIFKKLLGPDHYLVMQAANSLADLERPDGTQAISKQTLKNNLKHQINSLGPNHPDVANTLNNIAILYHHQYEYALAKKHYTQALKIWKSALGSDHPNVAKALNNLGECYLDTRQVDQAFDLFSQAMAIDEEQIDHILGFAAEKQKSLLLEMKRGDMFSFFSFIHQFKLHLPQAKQTAMDIWLKRKGIILESQKQFQQAILHSDDPQIKNIFQSLASARLERSKLVFSGNSNTSAGTYKNKKGRLDQTIQTLESKMSRLSKAFALNQRIAKASVKSVSDAMPEESVLIDFVRMRSYDFNSDNKKTAWGEYQYRAFVLNAGRKNSVEFIDLGNADIIDFAISGLKKKISNPEDPGIKRISKKLYKLLFKPLESHMGRSKKLFISPAGNLNLIPFEILQDDADKYLIQTYTINYLNSGRDIMAFGQINEKAGNPILIGDPDFDLNAGEKEGVLRALGIKPSQHQLMTLRSSSVNPEQEMRGLKFERLPGTRREVEAIHELIGRSKSQLFTGKSAIEEVIRQELPPSILHIATHGFFLPDIDRKAYKNTDESISSVNVISELNHFKGDVKNPLLRSGIVLAGANHALEQGQIASNDGILTAEKILGLQLRGTDMAVLSACETGIGEVKEGEGVYGLRRAFTQAGSKSLVMSMWSVPDRETQELMLRFYDYLIQKKMDRSDALRQAVLDQMDIIKTRYGHTHPFYWGAFIFLGEP